MFQNISNKLLFATMVSLETLVPLGGIVVSKGLTTGGLFVDLSTEMLDIVVELWKKRNVHLVRHTYSTYQSTQATSKGQYC